ncbi:hypothetical protein ACGFX8_02575 [Streptomyces sp. NPDC048362]|uniref:hypothetical protein n=1 Tax=Streptomyces sp. NPDC048362 TaxID=3365539 RepID=UPI00370FB526
MSGTRASCGEGRFLYVRYFRDLADLMADGRPPAPDVQARVMRRYATEPAADFARQPEGGRP